jgi:hypothetical protein
MLVSVSFCSWNGRARENEKIMTHKVAELAKRIVAHGSTHLVFGHLDLERAPSRPVESRYVRRMMV